MVYKILGTDMKTFSKELLAEIKKDEVFNGAATLAYYWMLAIFPAMIFLLSIIPYLPIADLPEAIMNFVLQVLPKESATLFSGIVTSVTKDKSSSLVSFGILAAFWASSSGMSAIMGQLNKTYEVKEARSFFKGRAVAIMMTIVFGLMIIAAFSLIIFGGYIQSFLISHFGYEGAWLIFFQIFRWVMIMALLFLGFAFLYYVGPNVEQSFRFISLGSILGVFLLVLASLVFQFYIENFANYSATYGSIGAVIILMLWFYIAGLVILLGSEVNSLIEHHHGIRKKKR